MKDGPALYVHKCYPLKSFGEIASLSEDKYFGNVLIICYTTTHSTTHAICWDIERKRILDSECRNEKFFTYTTFDCHSQEATAIVEALSTTINIPCIFTVAYWKKKSGTKRKR